MLEWLVTLNRGPREVKNEIVENELQLITHNGSAFDMYVVLNGLSNWHTKVMIVRNGKGIFL